MVTYAELAYGALRSARPERQREQLDRFVGRLEGQRIEDWVAGVGDSG